MKEAFIQDTTLAEHIDTIAPDGMETFLLFNAPTSGQFDEERDNAVRGAVLNGTRLVNLMRAAHELGILESFILGQAYLGTLLMTRSLKGNGRVALDIGCSGPVQGLSVEANARGDVRGYLKQAPIPLDGPVESFDTSAFFGPGILTVSRYTDGRSQPFTGNIDLYYGNIGQDIANYYLISEQTRTSVSVSIQFDAEGRIVGAGGLFIEALPGAEDAFLTELQQRIAAMPSLGASLAEGKTSFSILDDTFDGYYLRPMEHRQARFHCSCSRDRFKGFLRSMKLEDLTEMAVDGPFPVVTVCHNCNSRYEFTEEEMKELLRHRTAN